jgi:cytoskeleton protein RodZ
LTEPVTGDAAGTAATGVGRALAQAREAQGLALASVAQLLKFAPRQLEALEQERFEALPGATFVRGMVKSYARLLKLEAEPLLAQLSGRVGTPDANRLAVRFSEPVPFSDSGRRSTLVYLAFSVGILSLIGVVAYEWHKENTEPPRAAFVSPGASPAQAARPAPVQAQVASLSPSVPDLGSLKAEEGNSFAPAPGQPAADPQKTTVGQPVPGGRRIVLRCQQEAWVEIKDGSGRLLMSSLNPAGSERVLHGKPPFELIIGNASNVRLTYDDKPVDLQPFVKVEVARLTLK